MKKSTIEFTDTDDGGNELKLIFERGFDKKSTAHQIANIVAKHLEEKYTKDEGKNQ